jgi:hypothetical protein
MAEDSRVQMKDEWYDAKYDAKYTLRLGAAGEWPSRVARPAAGTRRGARSFRCA